MVKIKAKILIVDDEKGFVDATGKLLEKEGYVVFKALDGEEGLKTALEHSPDLILLDILMPKLDGTEVLNKLKQNPATAAIPVIILTALGERRDMAASLLVEGAVDYIGKPLDKNTLLEKIKEELSA